MRRWYVHEGSGRGVWGPPMAPEANIPKSVMGLMLFCGFVSNE